RTSGRSTASPARPSPRPPGDERGPAHRAGPRLPLGLVLAGQPCLVSQKILSISAIFASSSSATLTSMDDLVPAAPASLVASLNSWCSCGYFSKWGGLK